MLSASIGAVLLQLRAHGYLIVFFLSYLCFFSFIIILLNLYSYFCCLDIT
jgi:hypothetical protein